MKRCLLALLPAASALETWVGLDQQPIQANLSQAYDPFAGEGFDRYVNDVLAEQHTPGIAIAVVHGNSTYSRAYGYADLELKIPVTPKTLFFAGSTTKSFTAATTSKLVDSNVTEYAHISWTTKLVDLIRDDFVLEDDYTTNHINFVDALSHRTGMPRHDLSWIGHDPSLRDIVRQMRYLPLHRELRDTWEYCNIMFSAVSHAIETVTGTAMSVLLRQWIWEPLGMTETFYVLADALAYVEHSHDITMARSYEWVNDTSSYSKWALSDLPPSNGAGSVISNVLDYTHWVRMFLHPENASNPISTAAIKQMTTRHMIVNGDSSPSQDLTYGLGLEIASYRGHRLVEHGGEIAGYMTGMFWLPDLDWGVVLMQNTDSFAHVNIMWSMIDDFLDTPENERADPGAIERLARSKRLEQSKDPRKYLFPDAGALATVGPALSLPHYEGIYSHPAYGNLTISISSEGKSTAESRSGAPLPLYARPSAKHYCDLSTIFHHVNGEYWYAHVKSGPGHWLIDEYQKARFTIGSDGKVSGLGLQAEKALDELAWFERLA
ncbi:hypothetical protein BAUCODRAFT_35603 [Baudoinia panamericana UAMH 10762]|uniref:Beta-lactamase-related domain-containing protein n=1 Tax=Baudoinia panamericana (strain UAMH 10762) TaxID=717646 RepID=M2MSB2_BAUPA|nr:uncharacterized protein BAUCODRAFT_35603 [Baudoinia panamericana UAMH 10762]EMC94393.1 hypothetical protein BAUCODRAFT_35603 [Baudoinia panamericana UAMH 10762]